MRCCVCLAVLTFTLSGPGAARADEIDDDLAKQFAGVVRDTRLSRPARVAAAKSLAALGPKGAAAVPDLVAQLQRLEGVELEPLQVAVIEALGEIGPAARPVLPSLSRCYGRSTDIDQAIKHATTAVLASGDSLDLAILRRQLASRDPSVRLRAVKALAGSPSAAELRPALADGDGDVRRAAQSVVRLFAPDAIPVAELAASYVADFTHADATVRLVSVKRLGRLGKAAAGSSAAVEALLTNEPDRDVKRAAIETLAALAGP